MDTMDVTNQTVEGPGEAQTKGAGDSTPDPPAATLEGVAAERDRLIEERNDLLDRLLRRQAEFDNFRRRSERDRADVIEYANTESVQAILPILDDFERALR